MSNFKKLTGPYNFFTYGCATVTAISCYNAFLSSVIGVTDDRKASLSYRPNRPPQFNQLNFFRPGSGYYVNARVPFTIEYPDVLPIPNEIFLFNNYNFITYPFESRSITTYTAYICAAYGTSNSSNTAPISYRSNIPPQFNQLQTLSALSGYMIQAASPFYIFGPTATPTPTITQTPTNTPTKTVTPTVSKTLPLPTPTSSGITPTPTPTPTNIALQLCETDGIAYLVDGQSQLNYSYFIVDRPRGAGNGIAYVSTYGDPVNVYYYYYNSSTSQWECSDQYDVRYFYNNSFVSSEYFPQTNWRLEDTGEPANVVLQPGYCALTPTPTKTPTQTPANTPTTTPTNTRSTPTPTPTVTFTPTATLPSLRYMYLGGDFSSYNNQPVSKMVKIDYQGNIVSSFNNLAFNSSIYAICEDSTNGDIYVGGNFTTYGGQSRGRIVKLDIFGNEITSFNSGNAGFNADVNVIRRQNDGKILVGGIFSQYNGNGAYSYLVRLNSNGTVDATFAPATKPVGVRDIYIDTNGDIYAIGGFATPGVNFNQNIFVYKYNSSGVIDNTFVVGLTGNSTGGQNILPRQIKKDIDNNFVITGVFNYVNGTSAFGLVKVDSLGNVVTAFDTEPGFSAPSLYSNSLTDSIVIDSSGIFTAAGTGTSYKSNTNSIQKIKSLDASIDTNFNPPSFIAGSGKNVWSLYSDNDRGKLYYGTSLDNFFPGIGRIDSATGGIDVSFNPGGVGANGNVLVISKASAPVPTPTVTPSISPTPTVTPTITDTPTQTPTPTNVDVTQTPTVTPTVTPTQTFTPTQTPTVTPTISVTPTPTLTPTPTPWPSEKYAVAHTFLGSSAATYQGISAQPLFIVDQYGRRDLSFPAYQWGGGLIAGKPAVYKVCDNPFNGQLIVIGDFGSYNGNLVTNTAVINYDGSLASHPLNGNTQISDIYYKSADQIFVGGYFTSYNGDSSKGNKFTVIDSSGNISSAFTVSNFNANGGVVKIVVQSDNKIVLLGSFDQITLNSITYTGLGGVARLNSNFTFDTSYYTGKQAKLRYSGSGTFFPGSLDAILDEYDNLYVTGDFAVVDYGTSNMPITGICKFDPAGYVDSTFISPLTSWVRNVPNFAGMPKKLYIHPLTKRLYFSSSSADLNIKTNRSKQFVGRLTAPCTPTSIVFDTDAYTYIRTVTALEGRPLRYNALVAINDFVKGCKTDNNWDKIYTCCLLAGPNTLNGALVPLKGTAPTNNNFVAADYNSIFGLSGNGLNKYLNTNVSNNTLPVGNSHIAVYNSKLNYNLNEAASYSSFYGVQDGTAASYYAVSYATTPSYGLLIGHRTTGGLSFTNQRSTNIVTNGLYGAARNNTTNPNTAMFYFPKDPPQVVFDDYFWTGSTETASGTTKIGIFASINSNSTVTWYTSARIAFYSMGESVDWLKLKSRVHTYLSTLSSPPLCTETIDTSFVLLSSITNTGQYNNNFEISSDGLRLICPDAGSIQIDSTSIYGSINCLNYNDGSLETRFIGTTSFNNSSYYTVRPSSIKRLTFASTPTPTPTISVTPTPTPTISVTPTPTRTIPATPSPTPTISVSPTQSPTQTPSRTSPTTATPTPTRVTPTPTLTPTPTVTPSVTPTQTPDYIVKSLFLGGNFTSYNSNSNYKGLVKINYNGTIDNTFAFINFSSNATINHIADVVGNQYSSIIVSGNFSSVNGNPRGNIAKFKYDGTEDSAFITGTGFNGPVTKTAIDYINNKIYCIGDFTKYNGQNVSRVCRLQLNGILDSTFNLPGVSAVDILLDIQNNKFFLSELTGANKIKKYNYDGTQDIAFNGQTFFDGNTPNTGVSYAIAYSGAYVFPDVPNFNAIVATGKFNLYGTDTNTKDKQGVVLIDSNTGSVIQTFSSSSGFAGPTYGALYHSAIDYFSDNSVVIGGGQAYNSSSAGLIRLNQYGEIVSGFSNGAPITNINSVIADNQRNQIFVAGDNVYRLSGLGTLDSSFNSGNLGIAGGNVKNMLIANNTLFVTPTPTSSITPTPTPSITVSQSPTPTRSPSPTPTRSVTPTPTPSITVSVSPTPTISVTPTPSQTTPLTTQTPSPTISVTPSITPSPTRSIFANSITNPGPVGVFSPSQSLFAYNSVSNTAIFYYDDSVVNFTGDTTTMIIKNSTNGTTQMVIDFDQLYFVNGAKFGIRFTSTGNQYIGEFSKGTNNVVLCSFP